MQAGDAASNLSRLREQHSELAAAHAALQDEHERSAARNVTLGGLQARSDPSNLMALSSIVMLTSPMWRASP